MGLTGNETIEQITQMDSIRKIADYFLYNNPEAFSEEKIKRINDLAPDEERNSVLKGLRRLTSLAEAGEYYYPVYTEEECKEDPQMKDVNIIHFPAYDQKSAKDKPFILICAGGAYFNVWSFTEGYPVATRYNELGYNAFVLTYRTNGENLFPKPMNDVAAALRFIGKNAEKFQVTADKYIVCGFSAGGNLTCQWGTETTGYGAYGLPRPQAVFPIYPVVSFRRFLYDELFREMARVTMGDEISEETYHKYEVLEQINENYPPVYVTYCRDDDLVPPLNSELFQKKLEETGIPCRFDIGNVGGHGFGEGLLCDCAGWVKRSVEFYESL